MFIDPQGKPGAGKEEVKYNHAAHRGQNIAAAGGGSHGGQQHRQQIDGNDIRLRKAHLGKGPGHHRGQRQDHQRASPVLHQGHHVHFCPGSSGTVRAVRVGIRDDVNIHIGRHGDELFCQSGLAPGVLPGYRASANNDFGHPGQPGIFRNLVGYIVTHNGFHHGPQAPGQRRVLPESVPVGLGSPLIAGGLNEQCRKRAVKRLCHCGGGADDFRVGGCRRKARQNMFPWLLHHGRLPLFFAPL